MKKRLALLVVLSIGVGVSIPVMIGGMDAIGHVVSLSLFSLAVLSLVVLMTWLLNAWRFFLLFREHASGLTPLKTLGFVLACDFSVKSTPGGVGGPIASVALLGKVSVNAERTISVFSLILFLDLILAAILFLSIIFLWKKSFMDGGLLTSSLLLALFLGLSLLTLFSLIRHYRHLAVGSGRVLRRFEGGGRLAFALGRKVILVRQALRDALSLNLGVRILVVTLSTAFWIFQLSILYLVVTGLGGEISWGKAALAQVIAMGAGRVSLLPGGAGGVEITGVGVLLLWLEPELAAAGIMLWRAITLYPGLFVGGLAMLFFSMKESRTR